MKGHHKGHHMKHGGHAKHHKAHGGATSEGHLVASGNPNVIKEAEEKKHGGKVKHHGKHHRAAGGKVEKSVGLMTGGAVRQNLGKPGRKRGGGVGADMSPLSSAHRTHPAEKTPKTEEGGLST